MDLLNLSSLKWQYQELLTLFIFHLTDPFEPLMDILEHFLIKLWYSGEICIEISNFLHR